MPLPWVGLLLALGAAAALSACRENEQDRPWQLEPHVYRGKRLTPLTQRQEQELKERGNLQR